jgi:hypothetical protein
MQKVFINKFLNCNRIPGFLPTYQISFYIHLPRPKFLYEVFEINPTFRRYNRWRNQQKQAVINFCSFIAWSILRPWRWRRFLAPTRRLTLSGLRGVTALIQGPQTLRASSWRRFGDGADGSINVVEPSETTEQLASLFRAVGLYAVANVIPVQTGYRVPFVFTKCYLDLWRCCSLCLWFYMGVKHGLWQ